MLISRSIFTQRNTDKVSHFKYLGIWLSDDLTWSTHIELNMLAAKQGDFLDIYIAQVYSAYI